MISIGLYCVLHRYAEGTPEHRKANTYLAGGFRGILFCLTGDLDYFNAFFKAPNWNSASPCIHCPATTSGPNTWSDFLPTAMWRGQVYTKAIWNAMDTNLHKLSLLTLPGCSCWTVSYDWMHCKYLGFDQYSHGSTFAVLVHMVMPSSPEENLKTAWEFLKSYFKTNKTPTPFRYINKLSMFVRVNRFPKLRGKASEVRHLGPALCALWDAYMNLAISLHRKILTMLKCNVKLEQMLTEYQEDFAFPAGPGQTFEETCNNMLLLRTQVANHFVEEGLQYYDITSKSHFCQHIAMLARHISPRCTWAFMGEDQMRRLQKVAKACAPGNAVGVQSVKLARHYRLGLHLLLEG